MRRREFIVGLAGVAAWPLAARAQQGERVRRIGVLMPTAESDPEAKARLSGFTQGLAELGWTDSRNMRIDVRWTAGNVDLMRMFAKELVDLRPEIIFAATTPADIETAFAIAVSQRINAVYAGVGAFFVSRREQIAALALHHRLPTMSVVREAALAGQLMSYSNRIEDGYRQAGVYAGRILKGEKPADLPVVQPTKIELVINLKTAKALGLTIPETLLATADEVIQ